MYTYSHALTKTLMIAFITYTNNHYHSLFTQEIFQRGTPDQPQLLQKYIAATTPAEKENVCKEISEYESKLINDKAAKKQKVYEQKVKQLQQNINAMSDNAKKRKNTIEQNKAALSDEAKKRKNTIRANRKNTIEQNVANMTPEARKRKNTIAANQAKMSDEAKKRKVRKPKPHVCVICKQAKFEEAYRQKVWRQRNNQECKHRAICKLCMQ
jgi:hypothetical protein